MSGEEKLIEVNGTKVLLKEHPNSILVIRHDGNRDEVKLLLERKFQKPVSFLGELLAMTG